MTRHPPHPPGGLEPVTPPEGDTPRPAPPPSGVGRRSREFPGKTALKGEKLVEKRPAATRTHCKNGHALASELLRFTKGGKSRCRECDRLRSIARRHAWAARAREQGASSVAQSLSRDRQYHLKRRYGLTLQQFGELVDAQAGACPICAGALVMDRNNDERTASVDRCSETGVIRGVLCRRCSNAIARLGGSPLIASRAAAYLVGGGARFDPTSPNREPGGGQTPRTPSTDRRPRGAKE